MTASHWQTLRAVCRWTGIAIGALLIVMEILDAWLTPKVDWLWFGAAILLIWICRPRKRVATDDNSKV
jgi:hypothetical protein